MSVNMHSNDFTDRNQIAKRAGEIIYNSISSQDSVTTSDRMLNSGITQRRNDVEVAGHLYQGKISPVRRTFCLLVTFDLIFMFILWVIYAQLSNTSQVWSPFQTEVLDYYFKSSMFDTVMAAAVRFVFLILAYALFRINHWWMVATTTFLTCAFLLPKCFIFNFREHTKNNNPLSYALLIVSVLLCWIETWFLDFKVLPQENKHRLRSMAIASDAENNERRLLLGRHHASQLAATDDNEYYSPIESPDVSDDEQGADVRERLPAGRTHSRSAVYLPSSRTNKQEQEYLEEATKAWNIVCGWLDTDSSWKIESGEDAVTGCVRRKHIKNIGKVFLLQAHISVSPYVLWEELVYRIADSPRWNPTLTECRVLHSVSTDCDISYNIAAAGAKGLVASRDFVSVRKWGIHNGNYISAGCSTTHHDMPKQKNFIRGENGPGGWVFKPIPGKPNECEFLWFCNTKLKGLVPQALVDQALTGMLLDYLKYLRQHAEQLRQNH